MNDKLTESWKIFLLGVLLTVALFLLTPLYPLLINLIWGKHPDPRVIVMRQGHGLVATFLLENYGDAADRNVVITCEISPARIEWTRFSGKERMDLIPGGGLKGRTQFKFEELLPREIQGVIIKAKRPNRIGKISAWSEKSQDIDVIDSTLEIKVGTPQDVN